MKSTEDDMTAASQAAAAAPNQGQNLDINELFDLSDLAFSEPFAKLTSPLDILGDNLKVWMAEVMNLSGVKDEPIIREEVPANCHIEGRVYIAKGAVIEPFCYIKGPCYIGQGATVRHGAYIRGNVFVGAGAIVGHTTEVKNSVLLDGAKAAHFAYVGDSILGRNVNLGAGTKLANLKLNKSEVYIRYPAKGELMKVATGLKKMGALIGDGGQTGCNSVLSPGSVLLPGALVAPCHHSIGPVTAD